MADYRLPGCGCPIGWCRNKLDCWYFPHALTPSADLPACRDEDPATPATFAAAYPDPPDYQHPEDDDPEPGDFAASMTYEEAQHFLRKPHE